MPQTPGVYLGLFAGDTCIYATDHKERYVLRKCKRWNIKINEDTIQFIYISHRLTPPGAHLTLNGWNIPFINYAKYPGLIFAKGITWRLHTEMIEATVFRTFVRI
jgi:hypothetical protein